MKGKAIRTRREKMSGNTSPRLEVIWEITWAFLQRRRRRRRVPSGLVLLAPSSILLHSPPSVLCVKRPDPPRPTEQHNPPLPLFCNKPYLPSNLGLCCPPRFLSIRELSELPKQKRVNKHIRNPRFYCWASVEFLGDKEFVSFSFAQGVIPLSEVNKVGSEFVLIIQHDPPKEGLGIRDLVADL